MTDGAPPYACDATRWPERPRITIAKKTFARNVLAMDSRLRAKVGNRRKVLTCRPLRAKLTIADMLWRRESCSDIDVVVESVLGRKSRGEGDVGYLVFGAM